MSKGDPTMIFSAALTTRAVAVMARGEKGISVLQGPVAGHNTLWVDGGLLAFG